MAVLGAALLEPARCAQPGRRVGLLGDGVEVLAAYGLSSGQDGCAARTVVAWSSAVVSAAVLRRAAA